MKGFVLNSPLNTAHELHARGYDVLIVAYEFLERNYRAQEEWVDKLNDYKEGCSTKQPKRPTTALVSDFWRALKLPIKRLVLDECHRVKNHTGARHAAMKSLYYHSAILLSGTFLANQWSDVGGLIALLKGHPFSNFADFRCLFTTVDYAGRETGPDEVRVRLLQKFLLGCTIARPASLLKLPGHGYKRCGFDLNSEECEMVQHHTYLYGEAQKAAARDRQQAKGQANAKEGLDANPLYHAIRAQQYSLHSALVGMVEMDSEYNPSMTEMNPEYLAQDTRDRSGESRDKWLERLRDDDELVFPSSRVRIFLDLYRWLRSTYPEEKIVVFSKYLRFLDVVAEALRKHSQLEPLRYNGTVKLAQREVVRKAFETCPQWIPLLITGDAGGVGLNITTASIAVQLEIWWNQNTELQAYGRIHRQGQLRQVKIIHLEANNSDIDAIFLRVQRKKMVMNNRLMGPLVRHHDQAPIIPALPDLEYMPLR